MELPGFEIPLHVDEAIRAEAERTYPFECCGVLMWTPGEPTSLEAVPFENQQQRLHALDPTAYPRDARTAYAFDALKLERTLEAARTDGRALAAIFHSHPEHGAYFSETDRAAATPFGDATWPDAVQLVYAVLDRRAADVAAFRWEPEAGDFVEVPLTVASNS